MSVAAELDLAIGQIDDLLRKLQGKISQPTASLVNEPNAKSEEPAVALDPALPLKRMSTNAWRSGSKGPAESANTGSHAALQEPENGSPAATLSSSMQAASELFAKAQLQV